jgi:hypothetical protein
VQTIDLSYCNQITDKWLEHLKGVQTIDLSGCEQITDKWLEHLKGVQTIYLFGCNQITYKGLEYIKGANIFCWIININKIILQLEKEIHIKSDKYSNLIYRLKLLCFIGNNEYFCI